MSQGNSNPNLQAGPQGAGSIGPISSQMGPAPGQKMPQVVAPVPGPRGFMPINNSGVQRPGMGPMQPQSSTQSTVLPPAVTPAAPPPTVQTVDTSNVPGNVFGSFLFSSIHFLYFIFPF